MSKAPKEEVFNEFYHARPILVKWACYLAILTGLIVDLQYAFVARALNLYGTIIAVYSILPLVLYYYKKIVASIHFLLFGFMVAVCAQAIITGAVVHFLFMTLIPAKYALFCALLRISGSGVYACFPFPENSSIPKQLHGFWSGPMFATSWLSNRSAQF